MTDLLSFYEGKKVLVTGHTGFKGAYLARILEMAGAEVTGYSLLPPTDPSLFVLAHVKDDMNSIEGDVRDREHFLKVMKKASPDIVFHLAAQPLVRLSYEEPHLTYETNVMGTVNIMEALRLTDSVRSFVNITTDKVYYNDEGQTAFKEGDPLNGYDPYSNSKSCSDIITQSYRSSFFGDRDCAISTARAGNVIGGCDFAKDRLIPDCVRAAGEGGDIIIRNPYSVRPFQHVMEPLYAYLLLAKKQYEDKSFEGAYNVGPDKSDCVNAGDMADMFCTAWKNQTGADIKWINLSDNGPHEASFLMLDNQKIKDVLGWQSIWNVRDAIEKTVEMEAVRLSGRLVSRVLDQQIREYFNV